MCIEQAVGPTAPATRAPAPNRRQDVKTVQCLLNLNGAQLTPLATLANDGFWGPGTETHVRAFQERVVKIDSPDSRVDPGGETLRALRRSMSTDWSEHRLQGIMISAPRATVLRYLRPLHQKMLQHSISSPLRMSHFLAQIGHETLDLRYSEEIASGEAYEGRLDLGNTEPGDGVRFKGRGLIQLTGRSNYTLYGEAVTLSFLTDETAATIASDPHRAVDVACWYWTRHKLNVLADKDDVQGITRKINGGLNGLVDRAARLARAKFFLAT